MGPTESRVPEKKFVDRFHVVSSLHEKHHVKLRCFLSNLEKVLSLLTLLYMLCWPKFSDVKNAKTADKKPTVAGC
jgi:hypothetical protein